MSVVLSELPEHERPRERLVALGVEALSECELLALVLRSGRPGGSVVDLAGELLATFGGLTGVREARPEELATVRGLGPAKAAALVAAFRLCSLADRDRKTAVLATTADVAQVAVDNLSGLRRERVLVMVCDGGNRLARLVVVSEGSMDRSLVPVREILNAVLRHDGRGFALAHNHPSGDSSPSEADRIATAQVRAAASVVGLRFLDHIVVGGCGDWRSVIERG